jgi:hypothetical protein
VFWNILFVPGRRIPHFLWARSVIPYQNRPRPLHSTFLSNSFLINYTIYLSPCVIKWKVNTELYNFFVFNHIMYDILAARSKACVCGRWLAGISDSNPAGCIDVCLLWVLCVVRQKSLRRADHSSRGVLPTVVCV